MRRVCVYLILQWMCVGGCYATGMCTDDIVPNSNPGSCDFTNGTCGYMHGSEWKLHSGPLTQSGLFFGTHTLPAGHTTGSSNDQYVVRLSLNGAGEMRSPIVAAGNYCLSFWYVLSDQDMNLEVLLSIGTQMVPVWKNTSSPAFHSWTKVTLDLQTKQKFQVVFTSKLDGMKTVGIDDIVIESPKNIQIRLSGSNKTNQGRVEVFYNGQWGTVCDDFWSASDAAVVCKMLGLQFSDALWLGNAFYGQGSGSILMDNVKCVGNESSLAQCKFNGWNISDCTHGEDASVICQDSPSREYQPSCLLSSVNYTCGYTMGPGWSIHVGPFLLNGRVFPYFNNDPLNDGVYITFEYNGVDTAEYEVSDFESDCLSAASYNLSFWYVAPSYFDFGRVLLISSEGETLLRTLQPTRSWTNVSIQFNSSSDFKLCFRVMKTHRHFLLGIDAIELISDQNQNNSSRCNFTSRYLTIQPSSYYIIQDSSHVLSETLASANNKDTAITITPLPLSSETIIQPFSPVWMKATTKTFYLGVPSDITTSSFWIDTETTLTQNWPSLIMDTTTRMHRDKNTVHTLQQFHNETTRVIPSRSSTLHELSMTETPSLTINIEQLLCLISRRCDLEPSLSYNQTTQLLPSTRVEVPLVSTRSSTPSKTKIAMTTNLPSLYFEKTYTPQHETSTRYETGKITTPALSIIPVMTTSSLPSVKSRLEMNSTPSPSVVWVYPTSPEPSSLHTVYKQTSTAPATVRLEDGIMPSCSSTGWNITIDMMILRQLYPQITANHIYFGDSTCQGIEKGQWLIFQQGFDECITTKTMSGGALIYMNNIYYEVHDPFNPFIIRQHKWTYNVECDVIRNEATSSHVHHDTNVHHSAVTSHYVINMTFYSDINFMNQLPGNPIHVNIGDDVYVKVFTTASDWSVKLRLHTCYAKPSEDADNKMNYYIIKDGCEVDTNTHIISQSTHETRFVFQDFEYTTNREGFNIYCNATFCDTKDYSPGCAQSCNSFGTQALVGKK